MVLFATSTSEPVVMPDEAHVERAVFMLSKCADFTAVLHDHARRHRQKHPGGAAVGATGNATKKDKLETKTETNKKHTHTHARLKGVACIMAGLATGRHTAYCPKKTTRHIE